MDRQTVLILIDSLACGGAEKSLVSLLPLLDYSRLDVSLSIIRRGGMFESFVPREVKVVTFPEPCRVGKFLSSCLLSVSRRVLPLLGIKRHGAELGWICKKFVLPKIKEAFDIAIAYQQGFPTYYVAQKVIAKKKIAWINTDLSAAGYRERFNRHYYDEYSIICPVSEGLCALLSVSGYLDARKLFVVRDVLNVPLIREMAQEPQDLEWPSGKQIWRLATVGRMAAPKNYALAVEVAKELKKSGVCFFWVFVGDGSERKKIDRMICQYGLEKEIRAIGELKNPYPIIATCDIYVQTSSFEGFGLTVAEAKILNKPIVATNFNVVSSHISDGVDGLISEMTPQSVANSIVRLMEDGELRERIILETKKELTITQESGKEVVNNMLR